VQIIRPIFVNGFQRGGTNILVNLIASHPDAIALTRESHEFFYGKSRDGRVEKFFRGVMYLPMIALSQTHLFGLNNLADRGAFPGLAYRYFDRLLAHERKIALDRQKNLLEGGLESLPHARPIIKNVNGVVNTSAHFAQAYPDAKFIAIVRNGLAICEGFVRRGWDAAKVGRMYAAVCRRLIQDANEIPGYQIIKIEDLLLNPPETLEAIYSHLDMDAAKATLFRLQAKRSVDKSGNYTYAFGGKQDREVHWFPLEEVKANLRQDVNANQIARLSEVDKTAFLNEAGEVRAYFGYLP